MDANQTEQLEKMCRRQALLVAQGLRSGVSMLKCYDLIEVIEGSDKGRTFIDSLTNHLLKSLQPKQAVSNTLSLKKSA